MKNRKWIWLLVAIACVGAGYFFYSNSRYDATFTAAEPTNKRVDSETETEETFITEDDLIPTSTDVKSSEDWTYSFTKALNPDSIAPSNIVVLNSENKEVEVGLSLANENKTLTISPPEGDFVKGEEYLLSIDNLTYEDGSSVSAPYEESLIIEREDVENIELKEDLIKTEQEDVISFDETELVIKKGVAQSIEVGDIIVVPSNNNPIGRALQVKSIKNERKQYVITTTRPEFFELFDELDIHKSYPIQEENLKLAPDLEGVEILKDTTYFNHEVVAATDTKSKKVKEYIKQNKLTVNPKVNGVNISFSKFPVSKDYVLDGKMSFASKVKVDLKKFPKIKGSMVLKNQIKSETILKLADPDDKKKDSKSFDIRKAKVGKKHEKKFPIGTFKIPTSTPGVFISGDVNLVVLTKINAEPEVFFEFEYVEETGFRLKGKKVKMFTDSDLDVNAGLRGNGIGEFRAGPSVYANINALEVLGAGIEGYAGAKAKGIVTAGVDYENAMYGCVKGNANLFINGSVIVDTLFDYVLLKVSMPEINLPPKLSLGNCNYYNLFSSSPTKLALKNGESKKLDISSGYTDLITLKEKSGPFSDSENISWKVSDDDVVDVKEVIEDGTLRLEVTAKNRPIKAKTELKITYEIQDGLSGITSLETKDRAKVEELIVPIQILDFKKPVKLSEQDLKTLVEKRHQSVFDIMTEQQEAYYKENPSSNGEPDYDRIQEALSAVISEDFFDNHIKEDVGPWMSGTDALYMPTELSTNTRFIIAENTLDKFVVQIAQLENPVKVSAIITIEGIFEGDKWVLNDLTYQYKNINLTQKEAINYMEKDFYGNKDYSFEKEVNVIVNENEEKKKIYVFKNGEGKRYGLLSDTGNEIAEYENDEYIFNFEEGLVKKEIQSQSQDITLVNVPGPKESFNLIEEYLNGNLNKLFNIGMTRQEMVEIYGKEDDWAQDESSTMLRYGIYHYFFDEQDILSYVSFSFDKIAVKAVQVRFAEQNVSSDRDAGQLDVYWEYYTREDGNILFSSIPNDYEYFHSVIYNDPSGP